MAGHGYKKYMKKEVKQSRPLIKIFVVSFFGMLLIFTFIINYFSKVVTVDTSIGDYKEQTVDMEDKKIVDMNSLEMIQNEDQGRNFTDMMKKPTDVQAVNNDESNSQQELNSKTDAITTAPAVKEYIYKVYIGSYTSAEQAKVAKEIIMESGSGLSPIVKCIGANEYTLQVGIFKNKQSAETMLDLIKKSNLPGRIIQE